MKNNVAVVNYGWETSPEEHEDICILDFEIYKKRLFGGLKLDNRFRGWALVFKHPKDGEVDIETITLQDGNCYTQQSEPQLVWAILQAGANTLKNAGEEDKGLKLNRTAKEYFKKYIMR